MSEYSTDELVTWLLPSLGIPDTRLLLSKDVSDAIIAKLRAGDTDKIKADKLYEAAKDADEEPGNVLKEKKLRKAIADYGGKG